MANEVEVERLVARLVGDASGFIATMDDAIKKADESVAAIEARANEAAASAKLLESKARSMRAALDVAMKRQESMANEAARVIESLHGPNDRYQKQVERLRFLYRAGKLDADQYAAAIDRVRAAYVAAVPAAASLKERLDSVRKEAIEANNRAMQDAARIIESQKPPQVAYAARVDQLNNLLRAGHIGIGHYNEAMKRLRNEFRGAIPEVKTLSDRIAEKGREIRNAGLKWSLAAGTPIGLFMKSAAGAAMEMQRMEAGLMAVAGSAEEMGRQMKMAKDVAKLPGLDLKQAIQGATRLQVVGMEADMAFRAMQAFGNAVASAGGQSYQLESVTRQLQQMMGMGKVMGEELNIISESMPQFRQAIASAFGTMDMEVIRQAMEEGAISMKDFIEGVTQELEKLATVQGGASNALENLRSDWNELKVAIGRPLLEMLTPVIDAAAEALSTLTKWVNDLSPAWKRVAAAVGTVVVAVGPLLTTIGQLVSWLSQAAIVKFAFGKAAWALVAPLKSVAVAVAIAMAKFIAIGAVIYGIGYVIYKVAQRLGFFKKKAEETAAATEEVTKKTEEASEKAKKFPNLAVVMDKSKLKEQKRIAQEYGNTIAELNKRIETAKFRDQKFQVGFVAGPEGGTLAYNLKGADMIKLYELRQKGLNEEQLKYTANLMYIAELEERRANATRAVSDVVEELQKQYITAGMTAEQLKLYELRTLGATEAQLAMVDALQQQTQQQTQQRQKYAAMIKDYQDLEKELRKQAATAGMTADEIKRWELAQAGADAQMLQNIAVMQRQNQLLTLAKNTIEEHTPATEKLRKQYNDLAAALQMGMFKGNEDAFVKAVRKIRGELEEIDNKSKFTLEFEYKGMAAGTMEDIAQIRDQIRAVSQFKPDAEALAEGARARAAIGHIDRVVPMANPENAPMVPGAVPGASQHERQEMERQTKAMEQIAANTDPKKQKALKVSALNL